MKADDPIKYRPIAQLSTTYKLLERLIYNRIKVPIDNELPDEPVGIRGKRSCVGQVLVLATLKNIFICRRSGLGNASHEFSNGRRSLGRRCTQNEEKTIMTGASA